MRRIIHTKAMHLLLTWFALNAEDLQAYPAAMSQSDGKSMSGWVEAMWSVIEKKMKEGIPDEGIELSTMEVQQKTLAAVVQSLYTGILDLNEENVVETLQIVDYLQVSAFICLAQIADLHISRF